MSGKTVLGRVPHTTESEHVNSLTKVAAWTNTFRLQRKCNFSDLVCRFLKSLTSRIAIDVFRFKQCPQPLLVLFTHFEMFCTKSAGRRVIPVQSKTERCGELCVEGRTKVPCNHKRHRRQ